MYHELRAVAGHYFASERRGHTLQPTALVHEAWVRLAPQVGGDWSEERLKAAAAMVMRRVLVDHARSAGAIKRGGGAGRVSLSIVGIEAHEPQREVELVALDEALERLTAVFPRQARVVECKFFGGLEEAAIARLLGVSLSTVQADWRFARAWLKSELDGEPRP